MAEQTDMAAPLSLLPIKAVKARVGLSEATIYRMLHRGTFPKPRKVGFKSLWRSDELEAWIMKQGFESDVQQDAAA